jgi:hypothetical protein
MLEVLFSIIAGSLLRQAEDQEIELSDYIDFGSGIFAALLIVLSLTAYRNVRAKRLLFVSAAFGLFAVRALLSQVDLFIPEAQAATIELVLAVSGFGILALFFMAIVKKDGRRAGDSTGVKSE